MNPKNRYPDTPLSRLARSYRRYLAGENKSPATVTAYVGAVEDFNTYLAETGQPTDPAALARAHVSDFLAHLLEHYKPATAHNRYRGLKAFFGWCVDEEELERSPMERMKPPQVPEGETAVLDDAAIRRLLKVCEGPGFEERRDMAIVRLLLDTGMRLGEITGLKVSDLDMDGEEVTVLGKGRRPRTVSLGRKTLQALDRYLRARDRHSFAHLPGLWLGARGAFREGGNAISLMLMRRASAAGIGHIHPHQFRHTFAHLWLAEGGSETDLMKLAGWKSRQMLNRYGASAAAERARQAHRKQSPGDRF